MAAEAMCFIRKKLVVVLVLFEVLYATRNFDQPNKIKWAYHTGLSLFAKPAHSILFLSSSSTERRNYHKKRRYNDISKTIALSTIELIALKSTDTLSRHC